MTDQVDQTIQVAVIGVGRMGTHHARTYSNLPEAQLVAVVDADTERAGAVADEYDCDACESVDELLAKYPDVKAVTVAVPTKLHVPTATPLLQRGIACLVEKPLAPTVELCQSLVEDSQRSGTVLQVGHTERFNPAVRSLIKMNVRPRFMEVIRVSPMTFRSLDVGVVMDMMIHDLDIVLMLEQSRLKRVEAVGVAVMGEKEDICNARLEFESGCVANVTASRLSLRTERRMRLFSEEGYVNIDYQKRSGVLIRKSNNEAALNQVREQLAAGEDLSGVDYSDLVHVDQLEMDVPEGKQDPLTAQLSAFLDSVRTGSRPEVDGSAGYAAVAVAHQIVQAANEHQWEGLAPH